MKSTPAVVIFGSEFADVAAQIAAKAGGAVVITAQDADGLKKVFEGTPFDRMSPCQLCFAHSIPGRSIGTVAEVKDWVTRLQWNRAIAISLERNGKPELSFVNVEYSAQVTLVCEWVDALSDQCLGLAYSIEQAYKDEKIGLETRAVAKRHNIRDLYKMD